MQFLSPPQSPGKKAKISDLRNLALGEGSWHTVQPSFMICLPCEEKLEESGLGLLHSQVPLQCSQTAHPRLCDAIYNLPLSPLAGLMIFRDCLVVVSEQRAICRQRALLTYFYCDSRLSVCSVFCHMHVVGTTNSRWSLCDMFLI